MNGDDTLRSSGDSFCDCLGSRLDAASAGNHDAGTRGHGDTEIPELTATPRPRVPASAFVSLAGLPGADLITQGLADVVEGRVTTSACLVWIAQPRLSRAGLLIEGQSRPIENAELTLYRLLRAQGGDAFSQYNALLRRLASFEHALDRRTAPRRRQDDGVTGGANG